MVGASIVGVVLGWTSSPEDVHDLTKRIGEQTTDCSAITGGQVTTLHGVSITTSPLMPLCDPPPRWAPLSSRGAPHHPASH
ncbi:hypothetical protein [Sinomonas sp. G460-2]|uniref:hypothetical protein n=1 Tax=Sinomonas sp. G460-2 TaxID=3393464 RepID=UPI0039EF67E8